MMRTCTKVTPLAEQIGKQEDEKQDYSHLGAKLIKVLKEKNQDLTINGDLT